ncbi:MAG: sulfite exporter TauE/SafE family protein [Casimicrobiaceae bacterium]
MIEWLPPVPWQALVLVPCIVLVAYAVFGATGFGSSVIAVPALAHWFPLTFAVPFVTALDCGATATASYRQWRHARVDELKRVLPGVLLGILAGTTLLVNLARGPALFALGVFVIAYALYLLFARKERKPLSSAWAFPIGTIGGVFSVLFGTGGPIYIVYLSARIADKGALRATSSVLVACSVLIRAVVFVVTGLMLQQGLLLLAAVSVPAMYVGYLAGNRLHDVLSQAGVMRLIAVLLLGNGTLLVFRALATN